MPRITIPLAVNYHNISRPIAMSIARDVMKLCNIKLETPIYMTGEFEQLKQPGSNIGDTDEVRFESNQRIVVTADDSIKNDSVVTTLVRSNEEPPILEDRRLGISVRPIYVQSDVVLSFKYTCSTQQQAIKWRDEFAVRRAENRSAIHHEITYDIPIQDGLLGLLTHLHQLRERIAGYGDSFVEYFKAIQCREIAAVGAVDGDIQKLLLTVPETQAPVTGYFDFSDIPKEVKVSGNSTWEIEFTYKTTYRRCTHLYIAYPLLVHQQHISKRYFSSRPRFSVEELTKTGAIGVEALDILDRNVDSLPPPSDGLRFPFYDEWIPAPRAQPPYTYPSVTWMVAIDPASPTVLMNLLDIPDLRFTLEVEAYFKEVYAKLTLRGGASVLFTLFADDRPVDQSLIEIDADLNVLSKIPLDLRRQYHVRLSFPTFYPLFFGNAIDVMQKHTLATLQVFQTIIPELDVELALEKYTFGGKYLTRAYIHWFYRYLQNKGIGFGDIEREIDNRPYGPYPGGKFPGTGNHGSRRLGYRSGPKFVQYLSILSMKR